MYSIKKPVTFYGNSAKQHCAVSSVMTLSNWYSIVTYRYCLPIKSWL